MSENFIELIKEDKLFPIIRCNDAQEVVEIARAMVDGGIRTLEINVENPKIYTSIAKVSEFANVCAGGIIASLQAEAAVQNGAKLISSPIFQMNMVKISKSKHVPLVAGASTANEAYNAWKARVPLIKLYPTDAMGGVQYIEDILRQMPFLKLLPTGNIKLSEVIHYIKTGAVAVGVGRDLYRGFTPKEITQRTKEILREIKDFSEWNKK